MDTHDDTDLSRWTDDRLKTLAASPDWQPDPGSAYRQVSAALPPEKVRARAAAALAFAGVAVVFVAFVAFPPVRVLAERCAVACIDQANRVSQFLGMGALVPGGPSIGPNRPGTVAPDFTRRGASGEPVTLSSFQGKVVLLNFWATWCGPCTLEMPWFIEFQQKYESQGFAVLGVSLDEDGWESVRPFLKRMNVSYPVVIGDDDLARSYGDVNSLPTTLIIDRSGRIVSSHIGLVDKSDCEKAIQAALQQR